MKFRPAVQLTVLAVLASIALVSCDLLGVSIESRINQFVSSLNGDRSQTVNNIVPGSGPYNTINGNPAYWDALPGPSSEAPFSFSFTSSTPYDPNDTEGNITSNVATKLYKFVLQKVGSDYYISSLYVNTGTWIQVF
jgi:hypothetical protein